MNSIQAARLYHQFAEQADNTKPLKPQLLKHFVPVFWDGSVVLRQSWKGQIATLFERPAEYLSNCSKIYSAFSAAMQTVLEDDDQCQKLNPMLVFKMLDELEIDNFGSSEFSFLSSSEAETLKCQKEEKSRLYWDKIRRYSLLHRNSQATIPVDLNTLKSLLSSNVDTNPAKALSFLENFIQNYPAYAALDWQERLYRIRESGAKDQEIATLFKSEAIQDQKHSELLSELSSEMSRQVHALNAETGDKKLIQFSYGPKIFSVSAFFELMRNVPDQAFQGVSEQYKNILQSEDFQNLEVIGEKVISEFFKKISSMQIGKATPAALRPNADRHLPDQVAGKLPKVFEIWLENILKKGVIGNAAMLMPDENLKKVVEWISDHGDAIFLNNPDAINKLRKELVVIFKDHFKKIQDTYENGFINFFKWSQKVVSPVLMELLGIDHLMVSGPLWLEFQKNIDGTFDVTVYTLGNALNYHPIDSATGKHYAVTRLKQIQANKLSDEFFLSLLKRHVEPINDPSKSAKAYDIYSGPLSSLEGTIDTRLHDDPKGLEDKSPTSWQLALNLLFKQNIEGFNPNLQVCFQAMVDFCKPLMQDGRLVIPDINTCNVLENVVNEIYANLKQTQLSLEDERRLKATCTVVRNGIFKYYEGLNKFPLDIKVATLALDKDLLKGIKEYIFGMNISQSQLREYRGILSYFFGDKFGEFIDHLLENSDHLLRAELPPVERLPEGLLGGLYTSIYLTSIRHAVVLSAIAMGLVYQGWSHLLALSGFYYFYLPMPNVDKILPYALSKNLLEWYARGKEALLRKTSELIIMGAWALMPNTLRSKLKEKFDQWQSTVQYSTAMLRGEKRVSYKLAEPVPLKEGAIPREIPIQIKSFIHHLNGLRRFAYPINNIQCLAREGTDYISKMTFNKQLSFDVIPKSDGSFEADSNQFPGYHIASNQQHPALKHFPTYLILENHEGNKKALIPKHKLLQALLGKRMAYFSGPFADLMMTAVGAENPQKNEYFLFDVESSGHKGEENILTSSDPEACIYLLCLYYLMNDKKALQETQRRFDWICNNKSIPLSVIDQLVPLALIPFNFGSLRKLRRELFSAIGQHLDKQPNPASPKRAVTATSLILGIVALMDLDAYYEEKNSGKNFSPLQQYYLFRFSFNMLTEVLRMQSPKLGDMLEHGGIEAFIELVGLSNNLSSRFHELKSTLGVSESTALWSAKKGTAIFRTPSSLPKYLNLNDTAEIPNCRQEGFELYASSILSYGRKIKTTYLRFLNINALIKEMDIDFQTIPTLKSAQMTPDMIKKHFLAYYALARNDHPKSNPDLRQQLIDALRLNKGMGNKQSRVLQHYLETVLLYSDKCPPTSAFFKDGSQAFFSTLNDITFGKLFEKEVIDPLWNSGLQCFGSHLASNTLTNALIPYLFPPGLAQIAVDITTYAMRSIIYENLERVSKPLYKYLPSPTEPMTDKTIKTTRQKMTNVAARIIVPLGLILTANYTLSYLLPNNTQSTTLPQDLSYHAFAMVGSAFLRLGLSKVMNQKLSLKSVLPKYKCLSILPLAKVLNKTYNYVKTQVFDSVQSSVAQIESAYVERNINTYSILEATDKAIIQFFIDQKEEKSTLQLYKKLMQLRTNLAKHSKDEKNKILALFNTPFKFGPDIPVPLSLKEIHVLLDNGNVNQAGKAAGLTNFDHLLIEAVVMRIDYLKFRLKQFDGLLRLIKEGSSADIIAREVQACAAFKLDNVPSPSLRKYLHYLSSFKTQLLPFEDFSNTPLASVFDANKKKFAVSSTPENMEKLHEELWNLFSLRSHLLQTSREMVVTKEKLQSILVLLKGAKLAGEPLQIPKQAYQSLYEIYVERMDNDTDPQGESSPETKECLMLLKQILDYIKLHMEKPPLDIEVPLIGF